MIFSHCSCQFGLRHFFHTQALSRYSFNGTMLSQQSCNQPCHTFVAGCVIPGGQGSDPNYTLSTCQHKWSLESWSLYQKAESFTQGSPFMGLLGHRSSTSSGQRESISSPYSASSKPCAQPSSRPWANSWHMDKSCHTFNLKRHTNQPQGCSTSFLFYGTENWANVWHINIDDTIYMLIVT